MDAVAAHCRLPTTQDRVLVCSRERQVRIQIRYVVGIPFLFMVGQFGGSIMTEAVIIALLATFTDTMNEGRGGGSTPPGAS